MQRKNRDTLIDILKGIGIVSVVIGHSGALLPSLKNIPIEEFVYTYHLMVFFFVAGMLYHPKKYANSFEYIGRQLKSTVPLYLAYNILFLLFHNIFVEYNMLNANVYTTNNFVIYLCSIPVFGHNESYAGAMWFVVVLLVAKAVFSYLFELAQKSSHSWVVHGLIVIVTGALGLYTNYWGMFLLFHVQTAFLAVPIVYLGFLFDCYKEKVIHFFNLFTCLISAATIAWILSLEIGSIELASNQIISPLLFYPTTVLGIVFCISLARVIQRIKKLCMLVSYIGSISFHIMALHFLVFKCFDRIYGLIIGTDLETMGIFPVAYQNMGLIYSVLGIGIPTLLIYIVRHVRNQARVDNIDNGKQGIVQRN